MKLSDTILMGGILAAFAMSAVAMATPQKNHSYCDADFCGASRAELQQYHASSPWTSYDPAAVKLIQE